MPYLNLNVGTLIYEDLNDRQPQIRTTDITQRFNQVPVSEDDSSRVTLGPGQSKVVASTMRAVAWDATTQLQFNRYIASGNNVRIQYAGGTAPAFRTNRAIGGDATSTVTISRVSPYVARITNTAGTAWSLTNVQVGDIIKFEKNTDSFTSPFGSQNLGQSFVVQAKGSNYIDFLDNGSAHQDTGIVLGSSYAFALRVFSSGPVLIGDTVVVSGAGVNPSNQGRFIITDLSYDYIEIVNPYSEPETDTIGINVFNVYDYLMGFIHLRASGFLNIKYDGQVQWASIDRVGSEALLVGSVSAYQITVLNPDPSNNVTLSLQTAQVLKGC